MASRRYLVYRIFVLFGRVPLSAGTAIRFNSGTPAMTRADPRLTCFQCRFLRVTHDARRPWACNKFGFKSPNLPGQVVFASTGTKCANYLLREPARNAIESKDKGILA